MKDLEDDISEFNSTLSYPSSPGSGCQNRLDDTSEISHIDLLGGDKNQILSSRSVSLVPTPTADRSAKAKTVDTSVRGMGHTRGANWVIGRFLLFSFMQ